MCIRDSRTSVGRIPEPVERLRISTPSPRATPQRHRGRTHRRGSRTTRRRRPPSPSRKPRAQTTRLQRPTTRPLRTRPQRTRKSHAPHREPPTAKRLRTRRLHGGNPLRDGTPRQRRTRLTEPATALTNPPTALTDHPAHEAGGTLPQSLNPLRTKQFRVKRTLHRGRQTPRILRTPEILMDQRRNRITRTPSIPSPTSRKHPNPSQLSHITTQRTHAMHARSVRRTQHSTTQNPIHLKNKISTRAVLLIPPPQKLHRLPVILSQRKRRDSRGRLTTRRIHKTTSQRISTHSLHKRSSSQQPTSPTVQHSRRHRLTMLRAPLARLDG